MSAIVRRVTTRLIEREMTGGLRNPRQRWTRKRILLCFVESEGGAVGLGEAWVSGGSPRAVQAIIEDDLAPLVTGREPFEVTGLARQVERSVEVPLDVQRSVLVPVGVPFQIRHRSLPS